MAQRLGARSVRPTGRKKFTALGERWLRGYGHVPFSRGSGSWHPYGAAHNYLPLQLQRDLMNLAYSGTFTYLHMYIHRHTHIIKNKEIYLKKKKKKGSCYEL